MKKGFSLIEAIVGIALMLVVFVGLLGAFRMAVQIVGVSKARVGAVALANEQMESIRNLPYEEIGTVGGIPSGNIPQSETFLLNGVNYTRRVLIQYVDDPADGEGANDENGITTDYKRVRVEVRWEARHSADPVVLVSDIAPKGIETNAGGGTLKINVFDASVQPVASADVHIENNSTDPVVSVDVFTNSQGRVVFPGAQASGSYEITITKTGYSTAQTYDTTAENVDPRPAHLTIIEGETTEASFSIDLLSSKTVETYEPPSEDSWSDSFIDESKISATSSVVVADGEVKLASTTETGYEFSGYLISETIAPDALISWGELSWTDDEPVNTDIKYHLLYASTTGWVLIPESDLTGNTEGFDGSPVDLSGLDSSTYSNIRLRGNLSTLDASTTPVLFDWRVVWNANRIPIPFVDFFMRGDKIIGYDASSPANPIYKYSENLNTGASGSLAIENLEWDNYLITIDGAVTGYDIAESCPFQPVGIVPNTFDNLTALLLAPHQTNTFLVAVEDLDGNFLSGASVRLYRTDYDETQTSSDSCGQVFFSPLVDAIDYTLEVTQTGYEDFSLSNVEVSGQTSMKVMLSPL
jgi:type II secretory pathway pseudopilin PulG